MVLLAGAVLHHNLEDVDFLEGRSLLSHVISIGAGVDPKSVVCEYFRHGQCTKGFKCKFSHDLNVERKGGKIDVFSDRCA